GTCSAAPPAVPEWVAGLAARACSTPPHRPAREVCRTTWPVPPSVLSSARGFPLRLTLRGGVNEFDQSPEGVGGRLRQDAVAQVEDVARPAPGATEHVGGVSFHGVPRCEQRRRIEIALHRHRGTEAIPGVV